MGENECFITMKSRREKGGKIEGKVVDFTIFSPFDRQTFGWLNLFSGMGVDMRWLMFLLLSWDKSLYTNIVQYDNCKVCLPWTEQSHKVEGLLQWLSVNTQIEDDGKVFNEL